MKKINWGIIGLGNIAHNFAESIKISDNANLLSVASRNNDKLYKFSKKFNIEKKFQFLDYNELISCKDVDIIYIALPNSLHKFWVLQAIKNNKNILVEKPATINFDEAKMIKDELNKTNIFFSEAYMYKYLPHIFKVLEIIKNNEVGDLKSMHSYFGKNILTKKKFFFFKKRKKINPESRLFNKRLGGGCILDSGCYTLSFSLLISSLIRPLGKNNIKLENIKKQICETGVDVDATAELIFDDKFISKVHASFSKDIGNQSIIRGSQGSIIINDTWFGGDLVIQSNTNNKKIIKIDKRNLYVDQIQEISKHLINGKSNISFPLTNLSETLLITKLMDYWLKI